MNKYKSYMKKYNMDPVIQYKIIFNYLYINKKITLKYPNLVYIYN